MKKFVVGGVPEHFNFPWHLGIESGRFAERGIEVDYRDFPGGTGALTKALRDKSIDVAVLLTQGGVADILKGNPSKIVKVFVGSSLIWGIHVPADSEIKTVDEIQGKTIAISRNGSGSHLMSIVDAAERGWNSDDLDFKVVNNLKGARESFKSGTSEVFFWERFTTQPYVDSDEFRRVGIRESGWPAFVVCVREDVLDQDEAGLREMLDAVNAECQMLMDDEQAAEKIAERYELRLEETKTWLSKTSWNRDFDQPVAALEKVITYLNRLNIVECPDAVPSDVWRDLAE